MQPVTKITLLGFRLAAVVLAVYWITIFTGTHLPAVADFSPRVNDKIKHFGAYFVLVFLMCYVSNGPSPVRRFAIIFAIATAYAAFDEITQSFVPGRVADVKDFAADVAGAATAIAMYAVGRRIKASVWQPAPTAE